MEGRHLQLLFRALELVEDGDLLERVRAAGRTPGGGSYRRRRVNDGGCS